MKIIQVVPKLGIKQASFVTFSISLVEEKETEKILWDLSEKKVCQKLDIPLRIIKANIDKFTKFVPSSINEAITKAFDCMPHELSVAKLSSYGFDFKALKLIYSYINNRKQRVRKNESFNEWAELLFGSHKDAFLIYVILRSIFILQVILMTSPNIVLILILQCNENESRQMSFVVKYKLE